MESTVSSPPLQYHFYSNSMKEFVDFFRRAKGPNSVRMLKKGTNKLLEEHLYLVAEKEFIEGIYLRTVSGWNETYNHKQESKTIQVFKYNPETRVYVPNVTNLNRVSMIITKHLRDSELARYRTLIKSLLDTYDGGETPETVLRQRQWEMDFIREVARRNAEVVE